MHGQDKAPSSNQRLPNRDTDVIVSALAEVIRHAADLQSRAASAVEDLKQNSERCENAATGLENAGAALQDKITTEVAEAVGARFDKAVAGAAESLVKDLKAKMDELSGKVVSFQRTVCESQRLIEEQNKHITAKALTYFGMGAAAGMLLSLACIGCYAFLRARWLGG